MNNIYLKKVFLLKLCDNQSCCPPLVQNVKDDRDGPETHCGRNKVRV